MAKSIGFEKARKARLAEGVKSLKAKEKLVRAESKAEQQKFRREQILKKEKAARFKRLEKVLSKKIKSKRVLRKPPQVTVEIGQRQPAEHVPIFFKTEVEDVKKQLFFS